MAGELELPTREAVDAITKVVAEKFMCSPVSSVNGSGVDFIFREGTHVSEVVAYALVIYKNINEGR